MLVSLEKARLDKELRTAAEVQRMLLSRTAHVSTAWESAGDSLPCRAIGGDFFEIVHGVIDAVRTFCGAAEQSDDITITVTRRR